MSTYRWVARNRIWNSVYHLNSQLSCIHILIDNDPLPYFSNQQAPESSSKWWTLNTFDEQHPPGPFGTNLKNVYVNKLCEVVGIMLNSGQKPSTALITTWKFKHSTFLCKIQLQTWPGKGIVITNLVDIKTRKRCCLLSGMFSGLMLGVCNKMLCRNGLNLQEIFWRSRAISIIKCLQLAWANYVWPTGIFQKRDTLGATSTKLMHKTTNSKYLELTKGR